MDVNEIDSQHDWLRDCVADNLMQLVVLHLEGGPPAETLGITAQAWLRVMSGWPIAWNEKLDRPRLDAAFLALAGQVQRWPSPSQLRLLLPTRVYQQDGLDAPEYPETKAAANRRKIKQLVADAFRLKELRTRLTRLQANAGASNKEKAAEIAALKTEIAQLQQNIKEATQP